MPEVPDGPPVAAGVVHLAAADVVRLLGGHERRVQGLSLVGPTGVGLPMASRGRDASPQDVGVEAVPAPPTDATEAVGNAQATSPGPRVPHRLPEGAVPLRVLALGAPRVVRGRNGAPGQVPRRTRVAGDGAPARAVEEVLAPKDQAGLAGQAVAPRVLGRGRGHDAPPAAGPLVARVEGRVVGQGTGARAQGEARVLPLEPRPLDAVLVAGARRVVEGL